VLLISGKIDERAALGLAQKRFGAIAKPARALRATYTVEPTQDGERTVTLRRAGDVQIVSALYHMPPGTHPEYAAVDVLVALLNHVPSGRLHKALVETGLASSAFGTERQLREAGFAYFEQREAGRLMMPRDTPLEFSKASRLSPQPRGRWSAHVRGSTISSPPRRLATSPWRCPSAWASGTGGCCFCTATG
jgi:hypothetical protein